MKLILEEQQKYQQSCVNAVNANVTYQTINLFTSDKCFIYFISDVLHYIR